jgi:hypothetical protein
LEVPEMILLALITSDAFTVMVVFEKLSVGDESPIIGGHGL